MKNKRENLTLVLDSIFSKKPQGFSRENFGYLMREFNACHPNIFKNNFDFDDLSFDEKKDILHTVISHISLPDDFYFISVLYCETYFSIEYERKDKKIFQDLLFEKIGEEVIYSSLKMQLSYMKDNNTLQYVYPGNYAPQVVMKNLFKNYKKKSKANCHEDIQLILNLYYQDVCANDAYFIYKNILKISTFLSSPKYIEQFFQRYQPDDKFNNKLIKNSFDILNEKIPNATLTIKRKSKI